jgi:glycosyltransferase involved in cell wall biosynthesis
MKTSVVIPAYNEEKNIKRVLKTVKLAQKASIIDEIIVVDDGSKDKTSEIAETYEVKVIRNKKNLGKGAAMKEGIAAAKNELIMFLDADLINLKIIHLKNLLVPFELNENLGMTIGIFHKTGFASWFGNIIPAMSGQKVIRKNLIKKIDKLEKSGYGADVLIKREVSKYKAKIIIVPLHGVKQVFREKKKGIVRGSFGRIRMYKEIVQTLRSK